LKTGAAHVVGIERRSELVVNAAATFEHCGIARERYRFVAADVFEAVAEADLRFDVVLSSDSFTTPSATTN
jgi:23S rRNA G2069 N7-methylase RlmK/C1962 C5-methylase RlmI